MKFRVMAIFKNIQYLDACKCFLVFDSVIDAEWSKTIPQK